MIAALDAAGLVFDGRPHSVTIHSLGKVTDLYVIEKIYKDGMEIQGFHANVRTEDGYVIQALEPLTCVVQSPSFAFA